MCKTPSNEELQRRVQELERKVAELKQVEMDLLEEKNFSDSILNSLPGFYYLYDEDGNAIRFNKNIEEMTGFSADELLLRNALDFFRDSERGLIASKIKEVFTHGKSNAEANLVTKDGPTIPFYFSGICMPFNNKKYLLGMGLDLTELKHAEEMLIKSEEKYRILFEGSAEGILVADIGTNKLIYANPKICRMLEYTVDEFKQMNVSDIHPREALDHAIAEFEAQVRSGRTLVSNIPCLLKNGSIIYTDIKTAKARIDDCECNILFFTDITDRKSAEEALRESEKKYVTVVEKAKDGIAIAEDGMYKFVNPAWLQITGYSAEELLKMSIYDLAPPEYRDMVQVIYTARQAGEEPPSVYESRIQRKDGTVRDVEISAEIIQYDGRPAGMAILRDITDRIQAEKELSRLRNLLSNIVDSMPSVLVGVDSEGRVIQWNREAEKVAGVMAKDAQGRVLADVLPQLAGKMKWLRQSILDRKHRKEAKVARQSNGETVYSDITVYPLDANDIEGAVIRVDDVTERVRIEERLIQSEKMMSLGGLAAGMAHEINSPLAGILQNLEVMRNRMSSELPKNRSAAEECGSTMETIAAYMDKRGIFTIMKAVLESCLRSVNTVENMLSFSRKSEAQPTKHNMGELLDKTVELAEKDYDVKKKYDFRRIDIVREYDSSLPQVMCEGSKIQQVFLNILKNGAHAMSEYKKKIEAPRFILRVIKERNTACINIEDNGPGMDEQTLKRVFEPFFSTKPVGTGTGLGLSVSYFIITENHGGTMTVESSSGKGAKFVIRLPIERKVR